MYAGAPDTGSLLRSLNILRLCTATAATWSLSGRKLCQSKSTLNNSPCILQQCQTRTLSGLLWSYTPLWCCSSSYTYSTSAGSRPQSSPNCTAYMHGIRSRISKSARLCFTNNLRTGSVQFAILSGRILFRDVRYFSSSFSISILSGHLSFRYWLTSVWRESSAINHDKGIAFHVTCRNKPALQNKASY
jgi:hypothetical protein